MRKIKEVFIMSLIFFVVFSYGIKTYATEYEYDELNRVIKVMYEDGSYVTYRYDKNGNIEEVNVYSKDREIITEQQEEEITTESPEGEEEITTEGPEGEEEITTEGPVGEEETTTESPEGEEEITTEGPVGEEEITTEGPVGEEETTIYKEPDNDTETIHKPFEKTYFNGLKGLVETRAQTRQYIQWIKKDLHDKRMNELKEILPYEFWKWLYKVTYKQ